MKFKVNSMSSLFSLILPSPEWAGDDGRREPGRNAVQSVATTASLSPP
jgi:hypothetical protein